MAQSQRRLYHSPPLPTCGTVPATPQAPLAQDTTATHPPSALCTPRTPQEGARCPATHEDILGLQGIPGAHAQASENL